MWLYLSHDHTSFRGTLVICAAGDESSADEDADGMVREVRGGVEYTFRARPRETDEGLEEGTGSGPEDEGERYVTCNRNRRAVERASLAQVGRQAARVGRSAERGRGDHALSGAG